MVGGDPAPGGVPVAGPGFRSPGHGVGGQGPRPLGFNLNGIVKSRGRLLAVQSSTGKLFRINRFTGNSREVLLGGYVLTNGDGLEIRRDHLFVVRNRANLIAELDLNRRRTAGTLVRELTSTDFDVPTTAAGIGGSLWAVNARFGTDPTPDTAYWITRVPLRP